VTILHNARLEDSRMVDTMHVGETTWCKQFMVDKLSIQIIGVKPNSHLHNGAVRVFF
jgi:hypothetical protein